MFDSLIVGREYRVTEASQDLDDSDMENGMTWTGVFQGVAWVGWTADPASWQPAFGVFLIRSHPAAEEGRRLWSVRESDVEKVEPA